MARDIPILDVWTQHIKGTPPGVNPEGENVFRNYGMLDVYHHGTDLARMIDAMDRHGVRAALMAGDNEAVAEAQARYPGRIFGEYHANPTHIMKAVPVVSVIIVMRRKPQPAWMCRSRYESSTRSTPRGSIRPAFWSSMSW